MRKQLYSLEKDIYFPSVLKRTRTEMISGQVVQLKHRIIYSICDKLK